MTRSQAALVASSTVLLTVCYLLIFTIVRAEGEVKLNEFLPNPEGSDDGSEWLELYNPGGVDISDWTAEDGTGVPHRLGDFLITSGDYNVFNFPGAVLNNTGGDTVIIRDEGGNVVDSRTYNTAHEGTSFARVPDGGDWSALTGPTPGHSNGDAPEHSPSPSGTPEPSVFPTSTPQPSASPVPSTTPQPTATATPVMTASPEPSAYPKPSDVPAPSAVPDVPDVPQSPEAPDTPEVPDGANLWSRVQSHWERVLTRYGLTNQ